MATGTCNVTNGNCDYVPKLLHTACQTPNMCTYGGECDGAGTCMVKQGPTCAPSAECPIASACDGKGGCTIPADRDTKGNCAGKTGGDDCSTCNPCLQNQTCNASGDCVGAKVSNNTSCVTETCSGGLCQEGVCVCTAGNQADLTSPASTDDLSSTDDLAPPDDLTVLMSMMDDMGTDTSDLSVDQPDLLVASSDMTGGASSDLTSHSDSGPGAFGANRHKGCSMSDATATPFGFLILLALVAIRRRRTV